MTAQPSSALRSIPVRTDRALDAADADRLARTVQLARHYRRQRPQDLLASSHQAGAEDVRTVDAHCSFAHVGLLLFPTSVANGVEQLTAAGLAPEPVIPSVVVRRRLAERHGIDPRRADIGVTRLRGVDGVPVVELFLFARDSPALTGEVIATERRYGFEEHIALLIKRPNLSVVEELFDVLVRGHSFVWEGGGYNPHEGLDGSTIFYFIAASAPASSPRRFELHALGDFRQVLGRHPVNRDVAAATYAQWSRN